MGSGDEDGFIALWDISNGTLIKKIQTNSKTIWSLVISPDENSIVSGGVDGIVKIWNIQSNYSLTELKGHSGWVLCLAISLDGKFVASGASDGIIIIWSLMRKCLKYTINDKEVSIILSIDISSDSKFLAYASTRKVFIWNLETNDKFCSFKDHADIVWNVQFSKNSNRLLTSSRGGTLRFSYFYERHSLEYKEY